MANVDLQPLQTFTLVNAEASATIEAGMFVSFDGKKATSAAVAVGVALFDAAAGEAITVQNGYVNVLVTAAVTAGDALEITTAGKGTTASATTDIVMGYALDTLGAAGTVRAWVPPSPFRIAIA